MNVHHPLRVYTNNKRERAMPIYYIAVDTTVREQVEAGAWNFSKYSKNKNFDFLKESQKCYELALTASKCMTDKAFCRRKLASVIIRDVTRTQAHRYAEASQLLEISIKMYEIFLQLVDAGHHKAPTIRIELQRALEQQCHVALTLKDGLSLNEASAKLLPLAKSTQNIEFEVKAYFYLYQAMISKANKVMAKVMLNNAISLSEKNNMRVNPGDYRSSVLLNLCNVPDLKNEKDRDHIFNEKIENTFSQNVFFLHYTTYAPNAFKKWMSDSFVVLTYIRTIQKIYNIAGLPKADAQDDNAISPYMSDAMDNRTVYAYIKAEVNQKLGQWSISAVVMARVCEKIIEMFSKKGITLFHTLFADKIPPSIQLTQQKLDMVFPDYDQVVLDLKKYQPAKFIFFSFDKTRQDDTGKQIVETKLIESEDESNKDDLSF